MSAHGTYTTIDGRPAVRFERRIPHPVDRVWQAVTEPAELRHWFPCDVEADLRPGGAMRFEFAPDFSLEGEVLELDPPRVFAFRWGPDLLRFELEAQAEGTTRLTLLHVLVEEDEDAGAKTAAGWHVCLDVLGRRLDGDREATPSGGPTPEWRARYGEYVAAGMPSGASIHGLDDASTTR